MRPQFLSELKNLTEPTFKPRRRDREAKIDQKRIEIDESYLPPFTCRSPLGKDRRPFSGSPKIFESAEPRSGCAANDGVCSKDHPAKRADQGSRGHRQRLAFAAAGNSIRHGKSQMPWERFTSRQAILKEEEDDIRNRIVVHLGPEGRLADGRGNFRGHQKLAQGNEHKCTEFGRILPEKSGWEILMKPRKSMSCARMGIFLETPTQMQGAR